MSIWRNAAYYYALIQLLRSRCSPGVWERRFLLSRWGALPGVVAPLFSLM